MLSSTLSCENVRIEIDGDHGTTLRQKGETVTICYDKGFTTTSKKDLTIDINKACTLSVLDDESDRFYHEELLRFNKGIFTEGIWERTGSLISAKRILQNQITIAFMRELIESKDAKDGYRAYNLGDTDTVQAAINGIQNDGMKRTFILSYLI